jgi:hypothetical protein
MYHKLYNQGAENTLLAYWYLMIFELKMSANIFVIRFLTAPSIVMENFFPRSIIGGILH